MTAAHPLTPRRLAAALLLLLASAWVPVQAETQRHSPASDRAWLHLMNSVRHEWQARNSAPSSICLFEVISPPDSALVQQRLADCMSVPAQPPAATAPLPTDAEHDLRDLYHALDQRISEIDTGLLMQSRSPGACPYTPCESGWVRDLPAEPTSMKPLP